MPGGRPTEYRPEYCERVVELGKVGCSKAELARNFDVDRSTLNVWADRYPEFATALNKSSEYAQAWWEEKGREKTFDSEGFNATSFIFNMKNRFPKDWRDRQEITGADGGVLFDPSLLAAAAALKKQSEGEK